MLTLSSLSHLELPFVGLTAAELWEETKVFPKLDMGEV